MDAVLAYLTSTRLRAKEIASLTWATLTDAEGNIGDAIHLVDQASKGSFGRVIPLNNELKAALEQIQKAQVGGRAAASDRSLATSSG
jgi:integrase